jgi:hypothetical protein
MIPRIQFHGHCITGRSNDADVVNEDVNAAKLANCDRNRFRGRVLIGDICRHRPGGISIAGYEPTGLLGSFGDNVHNDNTRSRPSEKYGSGASISDALCYRASAADHRDLAVESRHSVRLLPPSFAHQLSRICSRAVCAVWRPSMPVKYPALHVTPWMTCCLLIPHALPKSTASFSPSTDWMTTLWRIIR